MCFADNVTIAKGSKLVDSYPLVLLKAVDWKMNREAVYFEISSIAKCRAVKAR